MGPDKLGNERFLTEPHSQGIPSACPVRTKKNVGGFAFQLYHRENRNATTAQSGMMAYFVAGEMVAEWLQSTRRRHKSIKRMA